MPLTDQQLADIDSRASVELVSVNYLLQGRELFNATMARAMNHIAAGGKVTITGNERGKDGWLEFGMLVEYGSGSKLFIGCIERTPGAPAEFHS